MRISGLLLVCLAFAVPVPWFFSLSGDFPFGAIVSQYLAALAVVALGIGQFLAARVPGTEVLFGGLDRIYVLHKWLAVFALVCLGLHDVINADIDSLGRATGLMDTAKDVGEVAFYGLLILALISVTLFIPYPYWRWSHRYIGVFFALGVFHYLFVQKPFDTLSPLGLYILGFGLLGLVSYLYMVLLYARLPGPARYRVAGLDAYAGACEIIMQPLNTGIRHRPGQFAFFGFDLPGLSEVHPFTISAGPEDGRELRICVKALGGYTDELVAGVREGTKVRVFGAFGRFRMPKGNGPQVWIAAGIGITPFMAWARGLDAPNSGPIHLYYVVRSVEGAPFLGELAAIAGAVPDFRLTVHNSTTQGRLTAAQLVQDHGSQMSAVSVSYCGPVALRKQLFADLVASGLKKSRFHYEEFEIRSGIGLLAAADWILRRFR
ncbi:MAG: ferredoxin reductase family protein [Rhodospirillales bacterium]|nr:ferredoxin reductase family protein [Rhodospirillales bacterium]